jgi:HPt (histidine-containing phosphotransfer) domain-containing protein
VLRWGIRRWLIGAEIVWLAMPFLQEQIDWIPSPSLVPDQTAIDMAHLRRMTLGERDLEREVLLLFAEQSRDLAERLAAAPADSLALAHTLKGSGRAIGAFGVADAAQSLESALRAQAGIADALRELAATVNEARSAIDIILGQP